MNDQSRMDDEQVGKEQREHTLQEDAAPNPVGVYDRPERSKTSPTMVAVIAIVLLIVVAAAVYVLVF